MSKIKMATSTANRHERRRSAKIFSIQQMTVSDLMKLPSVCAWEGCTAHTTAPDNEGWSKMILYRGTTQFDFMKIDERLMDRDCVLCPDHARDLDENLLKNFGRQFLNVAGNA